MTDFYSVLQRAVASLPDGSGPQRRAVYDKARKALLKQLQSFDPPLPSSDVTAQRLALEDAIRKIENEIARQIRTRRAVQGTIPAAGEARAAAPAIAGDQLKATPALQTPAPVAQAAQSAPSDERGIGTGTGTKEELLESAISEATLPDEAVRDDDLDPEVERGPAPSMVLAPQEVAPSVSAKPPPAKPVQPTPVPEAPIQFEDVPVDAALALGQQPRQVEPAAHGSNVVDGEYDEVLDEIVPDAPPRRRPRGDRAREDDDGEQRLLPPARGERSRGARRRSRERKRRAVPGFASRTMVARIALPVVVLALLVGASYAAFTQREALLAVLDGFDAPETSDAREPIETAATDPEVVKNSDRLPSTLEGEDTRAVVTTAWPPQGDPSGGAAGTDTPLDEELAAAPSEEDLGTEPSRIVGEDASAFAPEPGSAEPSTLEAPPPEDAADDAADLDAATQEVDPDGAELPSGDVGPSEAEIAAVEQTLAAESPAEEAEEAEAAASEVDTPPVGDVTPGNRQQAVLYEEAAQTGEQGSAVAGSVEWSMVRQAIAGGDPEPVVKANAVIGDRGVNATLTIRENRDGALPASHLIEIEFRVPDGFEGGGIKNVPGIIMKENEQSRGEALRGAAARVSAGLFWIALSEDELQRDENLRLLREREWIDIPILYESGRRAILTLQKGNDGFQSVNAAIQAWRSG